MRRNLVSRREQRDGAQETSTVSPTWSSSKVGVTCTRKRGRARVREGEPERNRKESKRAKET